MSTIQDRLKMIMKTQRLTASSFADKVGVQRSGVSHIMSGRNKPSLDFIQKTLNAFPRVNGDWLVSGRQLKNTSNKEEEFTGDLNEESSVDTNVTINNNTKVNNKQRQVEKVILFYNDGTYDITYPNEREVK